MELIIGIGLVILGGMVGSCLTIILYSAVVIGSRAEDGEAPYREGKTL